MLRGGDIKQLYPNWTIISAMEDLGAEYLGSDAFEEHAMAPLSDEWWQTERGKATLANVLESRAVESLYNTGRSDSRSSPDSDRSRSPSPHLPHALLRDLWSDYEAPQVSQISGNVWENLPNRYAIDTDESGILST